MFQFLSARPWIRLVFLVVKLMRLIELVFRDIYFILEVRIKGTVIVLSSDLPIKGRPGMPDSQQTFKYSSDQ